jgi:hypothetical protein
MGVDVMDKDRITPPRGYLREERPNVGVQYEVHLLAADPVIRNRRNRLMERLGNELRPQPL